MPVESNGLSDKYTVGPLENFRQRYQLGNCTVVLCSHADITQTEQLLLQTLRLEVADNQCPSRLPTDVLLEFMPPDIDLQAPRTLGKATATDDLQGKRTHTGYYWWCGYSTLQVFSAEARVVVQIKDCFWTYSLYLQRQFFFMAFYMLLRKKGLYCLHANGVVLGDKACLIAGSTGSGKSTLALNLALQNWQFWGDDTIALRLTDNDRVRGIALRRGSACSLKTAARAAETKACYEQAPALQDDKRLLAVESLCGVRVVQEADPKVLIFPSIQKQKNSSVTAIGQTETMARLIALSAGILTDRKDVGLQMALLEKLSRQAISYTMAQGSDALETPEKVAALLSRTIVENC